MTAAPAGIIDGYAHCGLLKYRPIEAVRQVMAQHGVVRAVLVQHMGEYDNSYLGGIAQAEPDKFAAAMLVDTADQDAAGHIQQWVERYRFRGIRLLAHTLATHRHIWEAAVRHGLNIVVYEETGITPYADELARFAEAHAEARLVISHLGVLRGVNADDLPAHDPIGALAHRPNVYVQVSGMHAFADPPYHCLVPLIERLVDSIGPARLLYGSNFPAMPDESVYGLELDLLRAGRLGVPAEALEQVTCQTAKGLWFD